jgi:DNA modification methylase
VTDSTTKQFKVSEVVYREDLYPRFEPNQATIYRYSESIEFLPPIKLNQNNILIDGFHRWKAHQIAGLDTIAADVVETPSEKELKKLAYRLNSNHGLTLTPEEKRKYAQEMIGELTVKELSAILSVDETSVRKWTDIQRAALKEERNRKIIESYLRAWNTQESIGEIFELSQKAVSDVIDSSFGKFLETSKDSRPPLYNIWNLQKKDTVDTHFGAFPQVFMENLLYYHTEPKDIVFDPFAGAGTTIDACKNMFRRYYCSDLIPKPGREADIKQHDITAGLPAGLPKPDLVFLDPPYWRQAEGKYSDLPSDFGNMDLIKFYDELEKLICSLRKWKVKRIAVVIQPTQWKNENHAFEDHIFRFHEMLFEDYEVEMRYILPYSTQQYTPQIVEDAKKESVCLALNRDLVIWKYTGLF